MFVEDKNLYIHIKIEFIQLLKQIGNGYHKQWDSRKVDTGHTEEL